MAEGNSTGATAMAEPKPFRLLALPDELWSRIGRMAIDDDDAAMADEFTITTAVYGSDRRTREFWGNRCKPLAIAQVCRVIRQELLPHFFESKVHIRIDDRTVKAMNRWLKAMDAKTRTHIYKAEILYPAENEFLGIDIGVHLRERLERWVAIEYTEVEAEESSESTKRDRWVKVKFC